jgi:rRNA biogenesis protein RRP5
VYYLIIQEGEIVEAYVLAVNERQDNLIDLSLRASRLARDTDKKPKFAEVTDFKSVAPGAVVRGYIKVVNTKSKTAFVSLNRNLVARVFFNNLSDGFVKDPVAKFPIGKMVEGRILRSVPFLTFHKKKKKKKKTAEISVVVVYSVDPKEQHIEMSLKKREVSKKFSYDDLEVGAKVKGYIKRIEKFGVFVTIKDAGIVGLCHLSELSDDKPMTEDEAKRTFSVGDYVKALILRKNPEKKQISLSMKPSHFENDEESDEEEEVVENDSSDDDEEEAALGDALTSSKKKRKAASSDDEAATAPPPNKKKKQVELVPESESSDDDEGLDVEAMDVDDSDEENDDGEDDDDDDEEEEEEEEEQPKSKKQSALASLGKIDLSAKAVLSAPMRATAADAKKAGSGKKDAAAAATTAKSQKQQQFAFIMMDS